MTDNGDAWKRLKEKMKQKRKTKDYPCNKKEKQPYGGETVVQRLSAYFSGKTQKYTRIGPREFVSFDADLNFITGNITLLWWPIVIIQNVTVKHKN